MQVELNQIDTLELALKDSLGKVSNIADLELLRRDWLGKDGVLKVLFRQLRDLGAEEKRNIAVKLNELKDKLEQFFETKAGEFGANKREAQLKSEYLDLSLPAQGAGLGGVHPIRLIERRFDALLAPFGFKKVEGPEIEEEYFCFDGLNIPKHHPARDMQDTFYTETGHVLRTHTTSVQARELSKGGLPVKVVCGGRAYRNETEDASHLSMFHQYELVWIEEGLTLSHLMGLLEYILKGLYGKRRKVRFVPKYYPYTEPSLGAQVDCVICKASGCAACGHSGWVTVLGSGMVHRKVLEEFKYDPEKVSGIAFGLGTARLAAQFYNAETLKLMYENDLRALRGIV